MLSKLHFILWTAASIAVSGFFLGCLSGCMGGLPTKDFVELIRDPAVQATLKEWAGRTDITNPTAGFYFVTGGEIRLTGVIVRGEVTGSAESAGVNPSRLRELGAATQPVRP